MVGMYNMFMFDNKGELTMNVNYQYSEVRNTHRFGPYFEPAAADRYDDDLLAGISIDAWKTDSDDESGTVIANVLLTTAGSIVVDYHDNAGRLSEQVQECILTAREDLRGIWREWKEKPPIKAVGGEDAVFETPN